MKKIISFGIGLIIVGSFCLNAGDMQEDAVREEQDKKINLIVLKYNNKYKKFKKKSQKRIAELNRTLKTIKMINNNKEFRDCLVIVSKIKSINEKKRLAKKYKKSGDLTKKEYLDIIEDLNSELEKISQKKRECEIKYREEF